MRFSFEDENGVIYRIPSREELNARHVAVHDRFHVSQHLKEAVDKVRRTEHRKLQEQGEETLKGSKFLFLSAPEKLDSERRAPSCASCSIATSKSVEPGRSKSNFAISGNVPMRGQL
jgi:Transposase